MENVIRKFNDYQPPRNPIRNLGNEIKDKDYTHTSTSSVFRTIFGEHHRAGGAQ